MTKPLRPWSALDEYQQRAIDFLYEHDEALAILPTGAGKTVVSMTAGDELMQQGTIRNPLVLAPLRVAQNTWPDERLEWEHLSHVQMVQWGTEPALWDPGPWQRSRVLHGQRWNAESRLRKIKDTIQRREVEAHIRDVKAEEKEVNRQLRQTPLLDGHWYILSHENIEWLTDLYEPGQSPFDLWVIDETGKFKNPKSPRYKALAAHAPKAKIRWGLNATPAPEGAIDLFAQVKVLDGGRLWGKSFYEWRHKYFAPEDFQGYSWRLQIGAFPLLMDSLNQIAFRVPDEALPYQKNIRHGQIKVELPKKARDAYTEMERHLAVELSNVPDEEIEIIAMSEASASAKLRQIAQGYIYEQLEDGRRIVHRLHDEKMHAVSDLIDNMEREPLLIAYQFDEDLEDLRRVWKDIPYLGQGVSSVTAREHIERWNKRERPVLALHPASASHGLNLQDGGHHICFYALPWGLDPYKQTAERIDRRGQKHMCFGHHIIARNTKDEQVSDGLLDKDASQKKIIAAIRAVI